MPDDQGWITKRTAEAKAKHPRITEAVSSRMEMLLTHQLSDRQQTNAQLKTMAKELLRDMIPPPPKPEATQ